MEDLHRLVLRPLCPRCICILEREFLLPPHITVIHRATECVLLFLLVFFAEMSSSSDSISGCDPTSSVLDVDEVGNTGGAIEIRDDVSVPYAVPAAFMADSKSAANPAQRDLLSPVETFGGSLFTQANGYVFNIVVTPCGHHFHYECIVMFITDSNLEKFRLCHACKGPVSFEGLTSDVVTIGDGDDGSSSGSTRATTEPLPTRPAHLTARNVVREEKRTSLPCRRRTSLPWRGRKRLLWRGLLNTKELFGVYVESVVPCGVRSEVCRHNAQLFFA